MMGVVKAGGKEVRKEKGADIPLLEYIQFLTLKIGKTQNLTIAVFCPCNISKNEHFPIIASDSSIFPIFSEM